MSCSADASTRHDARSASQLLPDGALSSEPTASLATDTYSFCRFAAAAAATQAAASERDGTANATADNAGLGLEPPNAEAGRVLIAVAGSDPAALELWDIDTGARAASFRPAHETSPPPDAAPGARSGMVLCVHAHTRDGVLYLLAGYEDGRRGASTHADGVRMSSPVPDSHAFPLFAASGCGTFARRRRRC